MAGIVNGPHSTVAAVRSALAELPGDAIVQKNAVGNLSVFDAETGDWLGYLDVHGARFVSIQEDAAS